MKTYTISESKAQLSALVQQVMESGESIVIGRHGRPMVVLSKYQCSGTNQRLGYFEGQIQLTEDFDEWGPEEAEAFGMAE